MTKKKLFSSIFIFIIIAGLTTFILMLPSFPLLSQNEEAIEFSVVEGESMYSVVKNLEENAEIHPLFPLYLNVYSRLKGTTDDIKPGTWQITSETLFNDFYHELLSGNEVLISITIPPGWPTSKVVARLEAANYGTKQEIQDAIENFDFTPYGFPGLKNAQGYLFPETYIVSQSYSISQIIDVFVSQFFDELAEISPDYSNLTSEQLNEKVTLASIVEGEYRQAVEAPLIASVFYNRLEENWPLQSCATILYVLEEEYNRPHKTRIFYSDLEIESDFNTYKNTGLPPLPINSPGRIALQASFHPEESDSFFFVVDNTRPGFHTFTNNYTDHQTAAAAYISSFIAKD